MRLKIFFSILRYRYNRRILFYVFLFGWFSYLLFLNITKKKYLDHCFKNLTIVSNLLDSTFFAYFAHFNIYIPIDT
jgi:hypothetical protein